MYTQVGIGIRLIVPLFLFLFLIVKRGEIHIQYNGLGIKDCPVTFNF